jgi:hypothetical protein
VVVLEVLSQKEQTDQILFLVLLPQPVVVGVLILAIHKRH